MRTAYYNAFLILILSLISSTHAMESLKKESKISILRAAYKAVHWVKTHPVTVSAAALISGSIIYALRQNISSSEQISGSQDSRTLAQASSQNSGLSGSARGMPGASGDNSDVSSHPKNQTQQPYSAALLEEYKRIVPSVATARVDDAKEAQVFDHKKYENILLAYFPNVLCKIIDGYATPYRNFTQGLVLNGHLSVAFSPDGESLATGSYDHTARLWNPRTGDCLREFKGHTGWITSVAFSPDGESLATGSYDHTARLWNTRTGDFLREFKGHTRWIHLVVFSPDGESLATGSNTAHLWNHRTGNFLREFKGHTRWIHSVAFSPDGKSSATGSNTAHLWNPRTGDCLREFKGHTAWINSVTFSPDGESLATGSNDNTARLWDIRTGGCLREFKGHTRSIYSVAFSPDGESLATGSDDHTARLWDIKSGQELQKIDTPAEIKSIAWSPDGYTLAAACRLNVYLFEKPRLFVKENSVNKKL